MRRILFCAMVCCAMVAGCQPASTPGANEAAGASPAVAPAPGAPGAKAAPDVTTANASAELVTNLSKGMAYADLRAAVLAQGWLPLISSSCERNLGRAAALCQSLPELDACGADGRCVMHFARDAALPLLRVDTQGDVAQWNATGPNAALRVDAWSAEPASVAAIATCPSRDFEGFLAAFAADDAVQHAHTAPLVRVMQNRDIGKDTVRFASFERGIDFEEFHLDHRRDGFHIEFADGGRDEKPTPVDIRAAANGSYDIAYAYGPSDVQRFRFDRNGDCWTLMGDTEAASP